MENTNSTPSEKAEKKPNLHQEKEQKGTIGKIKDFFTDEKWKVITGGLAAFSFLFLPLKDELFYFIWGEKIIIDVNLASIGDITLNKVYPVQISIYSQSPAPITEGTLEIIDSNNAFEIREGKSKFETPLIKTRKILPDTGKLLLRPIKSGEFPLVFQLKTSHSEYSDTVRVKISSSPVGKPTIYNWSGTWPMIIGPNRGAMNLIETQTGGNVTLSGYYQFFLNGDSTKILERGSIAGFRDNGFSISLMERNQQTKWDILVKPLDPTPVHGFIKLDGTAVLYKIKNGGWVPVKNQPFFSSSSVD